MAAEKSIKLLIASVLVYTFCCLELGLCDHFRGATLSWKPENASRATGYNKVIISFRIAWRKSFSYSTRCDQSTINSGNLIGPWGSNLECRSGCFGYLGSMNFKCTDFSDQEDWSAGGRTYTVTFPDVNPPLYQASFRGNNWIYLVTGGGSWEVRMYVNLTKRNDIGLINTSPTAAMSPIVRLQYGCNHTVVIPVSDADKDNIRCRWAEYIKYECAGVCRSFPGAVLDERKCQIKYSATYRTGWYAVAIMVEDFTDRLSHTALSSIPLQFLVQVFTSSAKCASKPEFTGKTRVDGSCIGVPYGSTFSEPIIAKSHGKGNSVIEIKTISPSGLTKSPLAQYSANEWYVNITWSPSKSQVDPVIFCYTAIDLNGLSSEQHCVTLLAQVAPPFMVNGSYSPTGLIYPNHQNWIMKFDKKFVRPTRSRYIKIFREDNAEAYSVDVSISRNVIYPAGLLGRTLEFRPSFKFIEKSTYYMLLDPGIAQGTEFCGPESPPMRDPYFWRFKIRDVTPPVVTFTSAPTVTNNSTTFTWRLDEPASSLCTVTSPTNTSVFVCNGSWVGSGLDEGYYRISITAIDAAGNIARPVLHFWNVDLTATSPYLTAKPRSVSKETSSTFIFNCRKDVTCYFQCSFTQDGMSPKYSPCYRSGFTVNNLVNGVSYVFWLKSRDSVGNQAPVLKYKWRVDTKPPTISNVKPLSVRCPSDIKPTAISKPSVTDNEDPAPRMTYKDSALLFDCGVRRIWIATDRAGNIAKANQTITIHSSLAPVINYDDNIVVACQTVLMMNSDIKRTINVTHPCRIPINISYSDSKAVIHCGSSLVRTWTAKDNCGHLKTVVQNIKVLALHLPDYPKNGQVNVNLNQNLNWPQYPGAVRYKVYIWKSIATKPTTPIAVTSSRVFYPSSAQFPHGTQIFWQVEYVKDSGKIIPSPIWSFITRHYPDFHIDSITLPSNAFSGQTIAVTWTVRNVGGAGATSFNWEDRIYLGRTTFFALSRWMSTVSQERFLAPNDAYVGRATIQLKVDEIGVFYVFVATDASKQIQDIDRSNNIKVSSSSVRVFLTPPPNLKVESIVLPSSSFSGKSITAKWTVANRGLGITGKSRWIDRLFLSRDDTLDDNDTNLGFKVHLGSLSVRQTYTETMTVNVPRAIFGDFYIIVMTDSTNDVFENAGESDNVLTSTSTLKVVLAPPPDLIVSNLDIQSPTFSSGSTINIAYSVANQGLGAPFHNWWNDQVLVTNLKTRSKKIIATPAYSGVLSAGGSYSRKVSFVVTPDLATGKYGLSVQTDVYEKVFEYTYKQNNVKEMNFSIFQTFPDLVVMQVQAFITSDPIATYVHINYTIENRGKGKTYGAPWVDRVFLSTSRSFSLKNSKNLGEIERQTNLGPNTSYHVVLAKFKVTRDIFGLCYIFVVVDAYSTILEQDENNNYGHSQEKTIPLMYPDLNVKMLGVQSGPYAYAGATIKVVWKVKNDGSGSTLDNSWSDMLYLSKTSSLGSNAVKIYECDVRQSVMPEHLYNYTAMVSTPANTYGEYFLIIKVNGYNSLKETDFSTNNIESTHILLGRMPQPDLKIGSVTYQYETFGNLVEVQWRVKNIGHSMIKTNMWNDRILLSQTTSELAGSGVYHVGSKDVTARLLSQQEYSASTIFSVPPDISGPMYVHVIVNYQGKLQEISLDQNNIRHASIPVPIKEYPLPILGVQIQSSLSTNVTCNEPFPFAFEVQNRGEDNAVFDSWTDVVFVYYKSDSSLREIMNYGRRIATRIRTGGLQVNATYTVNVTITISCLGMSEVYLYVFSDVNNRIGWKSSPKAFSKAIHLLPGPLPDLQGNFINSSLQTQGGSPFKAYFKISNSGNGFIKGGWINALYLSEDVLKDPFDLKLASQHANLGLAGNSSGLVEVVVFMPYDMVGSDYYLILEVDSGNLINEINEDNNIEYILIKIQPSISTDVLVSSVMTSPMKLNLGSVIKVDWTLRNNGSQSAKGYKCDSVYLSRDESWQIEDTPIAQPKCEYILLLPDNGRNLDTPYSLEKPLPLVAQGQYHGLVKSRSNIRDPFPNNNIKAGPRNINVTFPKLNLGSCVEAESETSVYIIDDVPSEMTLIVTASVNVATSFQDLYLRHRKPASPYHYDGNSKLANSAQQEALVTSTRKGSYYVMLKRNDLAPDRGVKSKICAKLAIFEITNIFPTTFAPLGNVTLRVEGTMFGWKLDVSLTAKDKGQELKAKRVYRFSSTLIYATFDILGFSEGTRFHCTITDKSSNAKAILNDSLTVKDGVPGKLILALKHPKVIGMIDTSYITLSYQNTGDIDLPSPIILLSVNDMTLLKHVQNGRQPSSDDQFYIVVAQPLEGPGGILPPKSSGILRFLAKHYPGKGAGRSRISVRTLLDDDEPHLFMTSKDELKPKNLSIDLWNPVWKNFLFSVGTTQKSLNRRLSSVATLMSLNGRRVQLVNDLVRFQLSFANGAQSGNTLIDTVDVADQVSSSLLTLRFERIYSPLLTVRRSKGIFGIGWITPWWETSISYMNDSIINILHMRDEIEFYFVQPGLFVADGGQMIEIISDDLVLTGVASEGSELLVFDLQSKKLKAIRSLNSVNEIINVTAYTTDNIPKQLEHSSGGSITLDFNSRGLVRKVVLIGYNGEQSIGLYYYDTDMSLLTSITSNDKTTSFSYTSNNDLESVIYPNGGKLRYSYNNDTGFIENIVGLTSDGLILKAVKFQYDWDGLVKVLNLVDNTSTTLVYDEYMNVLSITGDEEIPFRTRITRSENTLIKRLIYGDQVVQREILNTDKKTFKIEDGNGDKVEYLIGDDGSPRNITDGAGNVFSFIYNDNTTFPTESRFPDGSKEYFSYHEKDNLNKRTTRNGKTIILENGADGKVAKKSVPDVGPTYYLYDSQGNIIMATNKEGTVTLHYNRDSKPTSVRYPDGRYLQYKYNKNGQRTGLSENSTGYNISYNYDSYNRISVVHINGPEGEKELLKLKYYSDGRLRKRIMGNNGSTEYTYIAETRRLKKLVNLSPFEEELSWFEYDYDEKGRPVKITSKEITRLLAYDAASQLIGWTDVIKNGSRYKHAYEYDSRKNRVYSTDNGYRDNYETNNVNQYKSVGDYEFVYDKNGNMLSKKNKKLRAKDVKYVFSEENVLIQAETENERCKYRYDSLGNLYRKKCTSGETRYVMDPFGILGSNVIAQVSGGVSTLFVHTDEEGLIARLDVNGTANYYQFDGEGSVIGLTGQHGKTLNSYSYGPFGTILNIKESVANDFLFVGKWGVMRERSSPYLYRMRARHYDAQIGRFISYDPLGYQTFETNLYQYAYNNPMSLKDPQGRLPLLIKAVTGAGISMAVYHIGEHAWGEGNPSLAGYVNAAITGALGSARKPIAVVGVFAANVIVKGIQQLADGQPLNFEKLIINSSIATAVKFFPFGKIITKLSKVTSKLKGIKGVSKVRSRIYDRLAGIKGVSKVISDSLAGIKSVSRFMYRIYDSLKGIKGTTTFTSLIKGLARKYFSDNTIELYWKYGEKAVKDMIKNYMGDVLTPLKKKIKNVFENVLIPLKHEIKNSMKNVLIPLKDKIKKAMENVLMPIKDKIKNSLENVLIPLKEKVKKTLENVVIPLKEKIKNALENVEIALKDKIKNALENVLIPLKDNIKNDLKNVVIALKDKIKNTLERVVITLKDKMKYALENVLKALIEDKIIDAFWDWVTSNDPNDIIGPTGFGDARFIAGDIILAYKIRFENEPNATAPAQRVVIKYKLDQDLDPRTFRIGSFGFGNFTKELTPSPLLQERLDFVNDRNLLVQVTAGIDIVKNEATWDLQSLDPKTGESPRDPRRGFLPPNNGTTGQGFVTFSVRVKSGVRPLTRIDAQASIIFDHNEPIETPPIFNTIDNSQPSSNLTIIQDVLKKGYLAVTINKEDIGTGVQSVDIYYQEQTSGFRANNDSSFKQLLMDVTKNTVILPLAPGKSYKLVTSSVDHVGNKQYIQYRKSIFVDIPEIQSSCSQFDNCSNRGNCSMFSVCVCEEGFYGINCSQDKPPLDPPILEALSSGGIEDTAIPVFLSARLFGINITDDIFLSITLSGLPDSVQFSRGMRSRGEVTLRKQQFGDLFITPTKDFSGNLTLNIMAEAVRGHERLVTKSSLTINVQAKADVPTLITEDVCANATRVIPLSIKSWLNDKDGSEKLTIAFSRLPDGYQLSGAGRQENGTYYLKPDSLTGLVARYEGMFEPFVLKVVATSEEKSNGDRATYMSVINVTRCFLNFTCEEVKNCSGYGICVGQDECKCETGYSGRDCAEESDVNENPKKETNLAAIVGGSIGGFIFLLLAVILVYLIIRALKKPTVNNARIPRNFYSNPTAYNESYV